MHGARSEVTVRPRLRYLKQGILQPLGLRQADLDVVSRKYLDLLVRVLAKIEMYDAWAQKHAWVDDKGSTPGFAKEYYASVNSATRLLARLDEHLRRLEREGPSVLDLHVQAHYGGDELGAADG